MASFPSGTTPFFLEIESTLGSFVQENTLLHDAADQQPAPSLPFRYSVVIVNLVIWTALPKVKPGTVSSSLMQ
jgi:hypothetical protein